MADIRRFPLPPEDETGEKLRRYVPVAYHVLAIVFSVGATILSGGVFLGRWETDVVNLTTQVSIAVSGISSLKDAVADVNQRQAVEASEIDTLKRALQDERQERIDLERRLIK